MFLDLDGFKPVNDTFGHPKGDVVLKSVVAAAAQGSRAVRPCRPDGRRRIRDRHPATAKSRHLVETLAERLIAAIAEPFHIDKAEVRIGVSIGCAFGPIDGQSVDDLIQKADLALYQAKARAAAPAAIFYADMQNEAEDRLRLEQDMRAGDPRSSSSGSHYQPLINAADQSLMGFEALIRWHHPTRGIVSPNHFIPLAEETGLIMDLGDWVIDEACRAVATWPEQISVAINVSAKQLIIRRCPTRSTRRSANTGCRPNRLELEVTESIFLGDRPMPVDVLKRLRSLGVGIALDDFGTGYSSLGYLNKAVFHKLKIDGSFVREAANNKRDGRDHPVDRQPRQELPDDGHRRRGRDRRRFHPDARSRLPHQIQGYLFGRPMSFEKASELVHGIHQRLSA